MTLPIDGRLAEIVRLVAAGHNVVVEAAPGAGKTTRVPPALLAVGGGVVVLEPRRIAARMAARRVAGERGSKPGGEVGYQVRFEDVTSAQTRLSFVTEGVLLRRLLSNPRLDGIAVVCLDEFHERHLDTDLALTLLRRMQTTGRHDLRLVVMSATLDTAPISNFLGGCPVVRAEGRMFPLTIEHRPYSAAPIEEQVVSAVERLGEEDGGILVFLPGAAEIQRAARAVERVARAAGLVVAPLHGSLSAAEQDRAVQPGSERKLILATNVAESSITVEGIRAVIDSGLARVAADSPWSGLPVLRVQRISQAAARQRAGRAGRTGPGRVIRLYAEEDFLRRPPAETPEIFRRELSQLCLDLSALGIAEPESIAWLDAPPEQSLTAARELLHALGAFSAGGRVTALGRRMARLPLHPRLARMVVEGDLHGAGAAAARAAAWLAPGVSAPSANLLELAGAPMPAPVELAARQIRTAAQIRASRSAQSDDALMAAAFAAFPDRVAARAGGDGVVTLAAGGQARLVAGHAPEFLIALDIEERPERGLPLIRLWCPVEAETLLEAAVSADTVEWNAEAGRVEAVSTLSFGKLALEKTRSGSPDLTQAAALLAQQAARERAGRFVDADALKELLARSRYAATAGAAHALNEDDVSQALTDACRLRRSFAELEAAAPEILAALEERAGGRKLLDRFAPASLELPSGRRARIHYEEGKPPWIASRVQDFFGLRESPRIGTGAALVIHLLAPNQRPVQTTTDLRGFWERLYPKLRRELGRRYPTHAWPEDPTVVTGRPAKKS